jgi:hypothetical protein
VLSLEAPPAPPLGALASGVAAGGDPDDGDGDNSSSHDTDFSADHRDGNGYKPAGFYRPKPIPVKNIYAH